MIAIRPVASAADFADWATVKSRVEPNDPVTPEQLRRPLTGDRALLLAEVDWLLAGCGGAGLSTLGFQGYEDMALVRRPRMPRAEWLRTEATRREGSFVALAGGELVGYAGMWEHANGTATGEHGLTVVRRDYRRRGVATALKRTQLHWASTAGVHELVTWTQRGNEAMQALNRKLGCVDRSRELTFQGPLA